MWYNDAMIIEPKISVIVPIYGVEKYLRECVDSILTQSFNEIEIILIDDGGKDACPRIIDEYAKQDDRIIPIHKSNSGYGATVNAGLEKARGEYIAIIEPNDFLEPEMFEDLYNLAIKSGADIVKSAYYTNFDTKNYKNCVKQDISKGLDFENEGFKLETHPEFLSWHPSIWSAIYKKDFLNKHNIRLIEAPGAGWTDNPFQVQTMCLAEKIVYTNKAYYHWRVEQFNDEDALKDYTIPFKRAREINLWLKEQGITDKEFLKALYKREVSNAFLVLNKNELNTAKNRINVAQSFINELDDEICSLLTTKEQKQIRLLKAHPYICYLNVHFKKFLRTVFKIKWNSKQKYIILFNKMFNFS